MKPSVYVETSVISYLNARPSRDTVISGRQASTREWWEKCADRFEILVSVVVVSEAGRGDPVQATARLRSLEGIQSVLVSSEAADLAHRLLASGAVPPQCEEDALHIAVGAVQGVDYIVTWNFKHINNAEKRSAIVAALATCGYVCPIICTPDELGGMRDD